MNNDLPIYTSKYSLGERFKTKTVKINLLNTEIIKISF